MSLICKKQQYSQLVKQCLLISILIFQRGDKFPFSGKRPSNQVLGSKTPGATWSSVHTRVTRSPHKISAAAKADRLFSRRDPRAPRELWWMVAGSTMQLHKNGGCLFQSMLFTQIWTIESSQEETLHSGSRSPPNGLCANRPQDRLSPRWLSGLFFSSGISGVCRPLLSWEQFPELRTGSLQLLTLTRLLT